MASLVIPLSSSNNRPRRSNYSVSLAKSKVCTLSSDLDKAVIRRVSIPLCVWLHLSTWDLGQNEAVTGSESVEKTANDCDVAAGGLFVSMSGLPHLSFILTNGMFFVKEETQIVKRLGLFCHLCWSTHSLELSHFPTIELQGSV